MLTGWLPVYHQVNKLTKEQTKCPLCHNDETISHVYQCPHRTNWRRDFQRRLKDHLIKHHTSPDLTNNIEQHVNQLLHLSHQYHHFQHFTMFAGLLPQQWIMSHTHSNAPHHTQKWALTLSKWLTQQGYDLWLLRNKQVNDNDDTPPIHQRLNQQIEQLYQLQWEIPVTDRKLFDIPIEERYNLPEKLKQIWILEATGTYIYNLNL